MTTRLSAILLGALALFPQHQGTRAVEFKKVLALRPEEGVFAYARISPDGRRLAYASEMRDPDRGNRVVQTVTLVDLPSQKTLFTEQGIDAYFSLDGKRIIYSSQETGGVSIRDNESGAITRNVAPARLGDYYSWAVRDGRDLILTIQSWYYYLNGNIASLPAEQVVSCPGIGMGERPLISKDGRRISTFVRGNVVVRGLTDCEKTVDTGLHGQKADFSWDGRYVAFHVAKSGGAKGYDIVVVDLERKTMRTVTNFAGSSLFPSWTRDGRLCFRYDGDDYRGFMIASNVLSAPERPLPAPAPESAVGRSWSSIFPETKAPSEHLNLVLVWATWSAHSPVALADMQAARELFQRQKIDVSIMTATDPGSLPADVQRLVRAHHVELPLIPLAPERLHTADASNQMPTTLLFRDGRLIDRKLGAQSIEQLSAWVTAADGR